MAKYFLLFTFILLHGCKEKLEFNSGFESVNETKTFPVGWSFQAPSSKNFKLDTGIKYEGKYSLSIENSKHSYISQEIENYFFIEEDDKSEEGGSSIDLRGYMKTDKVEESYAGIWLRLEGVDEQLAFADQTQAGTHDWAEFSVRLPYSKKIKKIAYGGILYGVGKVWFDNFQVFVDGKSVSKIKHIPPKKAQSDTPFRNGSRIKEIPINSNNITNLTIVGQFWGFLKYHHPYVTSGDVNWDAQLFELLAKTLKCKSIDELSSSLEVYLDSLPEVKKRTGGNTSSSSKVVMNPDYGELLTGRILTKSLTSKLKYIQQNRRSKQNYWVKKDSYVGNPEFTNEKSYEEMVFPDAGYRLLCLFRYWSIINYYFPYKDVAQPDWNLVLKAFVPQFIAAKNAEEYTLTTLKLIAMVNDSHANIWGKNPILESIKGAYRTPFQADFIGNKLVVTGFSTDTLNIQDKIEFGDIILSINGEKVENLIKKYLPITPASNYETKLRDLPWDYLLRSNDQEIPLVINRKGKTINISVPLVNRKLKYKDPWHTRKEGYYLINDEIGYVDAGKYNSSEFPKIKRLFSKTKGMIVDLREYPSGDMANTIGSYIKPTKSLFVKFSIPNYSLPGSFIMADSVYNGSKKIDSAYHGKVVVIVNSGTQSSGEFTTMAFQSSPNVKVTGSQTAGADGNVTGIVLPGGIYTMISGIGIFYPDSSPTQRIGVKIDHIVKPTIQGIIDRKDELLERAIHILNDGQ